MGSQEDPGDFKQIIAKQYRGGKKRVASAGEKLADEALQTATALHNELIAKYCKPRSAHAWPWQKKWPNEGYLASRFASRDVILSSYSIPGYPPVIKHGNGKYTI